MSLLSCFAAGVFLATCLLDLFPEVREKLSGALDRLEIYTAYPVAEFVMSFGMFFILMVEQCVVTWKQMRAGSELDKERTPLLGNKPRRVRQRSHQIAINGGEFSTSVSSMEASQISQSSLDSLPVNDDDDDEEDDEHSPIRALILLLALSLHSIFEGLAVGLQPTSSEVLQIFVALLLHKCILAFSLGLNLVQSKMSTGAIVRANLIFSITSPLGIGIGIAVTDFESSSPVSKLVDGLFQGIACGTFVYIVFFEILPHEFNSFIKHPSRLLKVLFLILGYSTVALLLFLEPGNISIHSIDSVTPSP